MSAFQLRHLARFALAAALAPCLAGCDEPVPPGPMSLVQAASNAEGDGHHARAALAGESLREQMQLYFGERFADEQREPGQQPRSAQSGVPAY